MTQAQNDADHVVEHRRPRRLWYGLGVMFLVTLAAGVTGVVLHRVVHARQQAQQRAAVEQVLARGGDAQSIYSSVPIGAWLENGNAPNLLGLNSKNVTDDDLRIFKTAPTTRGLLLFDNQITDVGLVH